MGGGGEREERGERGERERADERGWGSIPEILLEADLKSSHLCAAT